jgi:hypothetical protein
MKIPCLLSLLMLLSGTLTYSQVSSDSMLYYPGFSLLAEAKTSDNFLEAAFYFEQLVKQKPDQWLFLYYTGFSYLQASHKALSSKTKDELIDKAQPFIDRAFKLKPGEPELYVLQAFLYQTRLLVNGETRTISFAQKAEASLKKALDINNANPRAYFLLGCNKYYAPEFAGGGAKNALPLFIKSSEKFTSFVAASPYMPQWGEYENQQMIAECRKKIK